MSKICAIVVTYNRYELLKECLKSLLEQTKPLDILLIDNNSTDKTDKSLKDDGFLENKNLFYKKLLLHVKKNSPYSAYASKLFIGTKQNHTLSLSGYGHRGYFDYYNPLPSFQKPLKKEDYETKTSLVDMASFVGILIPATLVSKIGLPRDDFFIHHDDVEYSLRLVKLGKILMVNDSHIYHKEKRQDEKILKKCCGFSKKRVRYDMLWIKYFGVRNSIYIALRYGKNPFIIFTILWQYLILLKDIILFDDHKLKRIYFASSSVFDGIFGVFDNEKAKRILNIDG